jgi:hypothetical protein
MPADRAHRESHDEEQRFTAAMFFIVEIDAVGYEMRHDEESPFQEVSCRTKVSSMYHALRNTCFVLRET